MKLLLICFLFFSFLSPVKASQKTDKLNLPYEITDITLHDDQITISGWGFITNQQHFIDRSTHAAFLDLYVDGSFQKSYPADMTAIDQTETMQMLNVKRCSALYQNSEVCYYDYRNVGFNFAIPLDDLEIEHRYTLNLRIQAFQSGSEMTTPIFYPLRIPVRKVIDNEYTITLVSDLYENQMQVVYDYVLDRYAPSKNAFRKSNQTCGSIYGSNRYFRPNSMYLNIFDSIRTQNTTYYKIFTTSQSSCSQGKNYIDEGSEIESYIPGNFVDMIGNPLVIELAPLNEAPEITIYQHPSLQAKQDFNLLDYAGAFDQEDGDLSAKIEIIKGEILDQPGVYPLTLYVEDSQGLSDTKLLIVTIVEQENQPPLIHAVDRVIYQYEPFDYYEDVWANDFEDGDITFFINYVGFVNIEELGIYPVTYFVVDSKGEYSEITIYVQVVRNPREKLRYIDPIYPFYNEEIPRNWIYKYQFLFEQLAHPTCLIEKTFNLE